MVGMKLLFFPFGFHSDEVKVIQQYPKKTLSLERRPGEKISIEAERAREKEISTCSDCVMARWKRQESLATTI